MSSTIDSEKRAEYWKKFEDGSPQRWKSVLREGTWTFEFPNGAVQTLTQLHPEFSWIGSFRVDSDSTRLWVNSLRYLVDVVESGDVSFVLKALESFRSHLLLFRDRPKELFSGSIDHQSALQLRTCCELLAWLEKNSESISEAEDLQLRQLLVDIVENIRHLVDELDLRQPNNHGIMLGIAELHSSYFFPDRTMQNSADDPKKYTDFLCASLSGILGNDGLSNENTVIYQSFYVRLLKEIADFLRWVGNSEESVFQELTALASRALSHLLLPNNQVPPIGDGTASNQSTYTSLNGVWQSRENGIFVRSSEETYLSFVCGFRGVFHKQMDDTSIILWHKGRYLIQDAGLASYDKNDPVAVSLRKQLGHSGVFFKKFDDIAAEKVVSYGAGTRLVRSRMEPYSYLESGNLTVRGLVDHRGTLIERGLTFESEHSFYIRDVVKGGSEDNPAVSRFLLDPNSSIQFLKNGVILVANGAVNMRISRKGGIHNAAIHYGDKSDPARPKGFIAPRNYTTLPTYLLEIPIPLDSTGTGKSSLRIDVGIED